MPEKRGFRFAWELRQAANQDEAEVMIYSEIVSYKWSERDPEVTAQEFDKLLKEAKKSGAKNLKLRINSPGGSVWQAVAMKTMVEMSGFDSITVDIEGLCASAATFFVCLPGARVRIARGSEFMIHNPRAGLSGTAADFARNAERLRKMETDQHAMYAQRTGQSEEQIKAWMDGETWFTAEEAVNYGFADEILTAAQAAACASVESVQLMQEIYSRVPEEILREPEQTEVSHEGEPSSEHIQETNEEGNQNMEIRDITEQQLQEQNPELYENILNRGITAERTRIQEIEAMTDSGFEELARTAKENGTSSADFLKQVVAERGKRRKDFLSNRQEETAPAQNVTGGASTDHDGKGTEEQEIQAFAKEMAEMAQAYKADRSGGMY